MAECEPSAQGGDYKGDVLVLPDLGWPLPDTVGAIMTTRAGGVSEGPYGLPGGGVGGLNLGTRCGDDPARVQANRQRLRAMLPSEPVWLNQVHGSEVNVAVRSDRSPAESVEPVADAAVTADPGVVLCIQCADCLPVLFSDEAGARIGAAHAGWRGLAGGVLESCINALHALPGPSSEIVAWLGPAIGPTAFEVGEDVLDACLVGDPGAGSCFSRTGKPGKWMADLFSLARRRLDRAGIHKIGGGGQCTVSLEEHYFSHRRDRVSGRQAALIWIKG